MKMYTVKIELSEYDMLKEKARRYDDYVAYMKSKNGRMLFETERAILNIKDEEEVKQDGNNV